MIVSAQSSFKAKAVMTMDPWMYANCEDFQKAELKVKSPLIVINSENFHESCLKDFESWDTVLSTLENCED